MNIIKKVNRLCLIAKIYFLKRKATRLANETQIQHFIVKWNGQITIISKRGFKMARQKGLFPKSFTALNLEKIALFNVRPKK